MQTLCKQYYYKKKKSIFLKSFRLYMTSVKISLRNASNAAEVQDFCTSAEVEQGPVLRVIISEKGHVWFRSGYGRDI